MLILAAGWWVFSPALHGDWLWDDDLLLTRNSLVHDPGGLWKIWFQPETLVDYFPLKVTVEWIEWHLWGNHPYGYHVLTVLLHLTAALLVWRLFSKLGLRLAWLGGLLFAVHPVVVESVAWIAELKNTLSLPPFLLAICFYLDYEERRKRTYYVMALVLFLVAMLCKPTMIMFPFVILLFAWWKRDRVGLHDFKVAAPFLAISLWLGGMTVLFIRHQAGSRGFIPMGGPWSRCACAGLSLAFYFSKAVLPVNLMPVYPRWVVDPPSLVQFLPWPMLALLLNALWRKRHSWGRHALLGLGFFLIMLLPFIGFVAGTYMNQTWVMDHMVYLPLVGLLGVLIAMAGHLSGQLSPVLRRASAVIFGTLIALLAWESHEYAGVFINQETLWTYQLRHNPESFAARDNLGLALLAKGRVVEAMQEFQEAVRLAPHNPDGERNLGFACRQEGREDDASIHFHRALQIDPDDVEALHALGVASLQKGETDEAMGYFQKELTLQPEMADAHLQLGNAWHQKGEEVRAVIEFQEALEIQPDLAAARFNLGNAFLGSGRLVEAAEQYREVLKLKPDSADVHCNLGVALAREGLAAEAARQFHLALQIDPGYVPASKNLAQLESLQKSVPAKNPSGPGEKPAP